MASQLVRKPGVRVAMELDDVETNVFRGAGNLTRRKRAEHAHAPHPGSTAVQHRPRGSNIQVPWPASEHDTDESRADT
jgi:hypothetical protein